MVTNNIGLDITRMLSQKSGRHYNWDQLSREPNQSRDIDETKDRLQNNVLCG